MARPRAGGQGPDAQPGRLHRACLQLHLPHRVHEDDDGADPRQHRAVPGAGGIHPERRDRGGAHGRAHGRAAPPLLRGQGVGDSRRACHARRDTQAGAVPRRVDDPRRRALPDRGRGRFAPGRHPDAGAGAGRRRADRAGRDRGARHRHHRHREQAAGAGRPHHRGRDRDRDLRDLLRRLEPPHRPDGRGAAGADPDRAPDDQCRAHRAVRRHRRGDLLPDRAGRGHQHVRAPARRRHGGRLLRAPADDRQPRRHPVQRGSGTVPDRDAVHRRRLRPAARRGPGADAGTAR